MLLYRFKISERDTPFYIQFQSLLLVNLFCYFSFFLKVAQQMSAVSELAVRTEADRLIEAKRISLQEKDLYIRVLRKKRNNYTYLVP